MPHPGDLQNCHAMNMGDGKGSVKRLRALTPRQANLRWSAPRFTKPPNL
jgi:hypothetical protein